MQSGITASQELLDTFKDFVADPNSRGLLVSIEKEALVPKQTINQQGSFEDDLTQLGDLLKDNEASYIILRRRDSGIAPFIAIAYVPDIANVRQKMLFASTRNTLLRVLGTERFEESIFATTKAELTVEGFKKHDDHGAKPPPLTEEERLLKEVRDLEAAASTGTSAKKSHVKGIDVPMKDEVKKALIGLSDGSNGQNLIQLSIDVPTETIELAECSETNADGLSSAISDVSPRYSFFLFKHEHKGTEYQPIIFIYTSPPQTKIKERMLYALTKNAFINTVETQLGLKIEKKLEASSPSDISLESLLDELHPKEEQKQAFARPKRPGRR